MRGALTALTSSAFRRGEPQKQPWPPLPTSEPCREKAGHPTVQGSAKTSLQPAVDERFKGQKSGALGGHFGFTGRAEVTEVQPAHACRRGGAQALSTEPAGGFNHTEGLETQHFLSAESSVGSAATVKSRKCLLLRHRRGPGPSWGRSHC